MNNDEIESKIPSKCPKCGSDLQERTGKYGKFLGCTNFPQCRYTFDLSGNTTEIKCPSCGKNLRFRSSTYGRFLSCSGYPDCKFAFNPNFSEHPDVFCPKCGKTLEMKTENNNKYLSCPDGDFSIDWVEDKDVLEKQKNYPKCPNCNGDLIKRTGKFGTFLGCSNYPNCKFTFDPENDNQAELTCPECGKKLEIRQGQYGTFVGCSGFPDCRYIFDLRK
ncbi:MAG: type I DNA topoisomerase [Promethearchaeota archaeon]